MAVVTTKVLTRVSAPGLAEEKARELQDDLNVFLAGLPFNTVLDVRYLTDQMAPSQVFQQAIVVYLV